MNTVVLTDAKRPSGAARQGTGKPKSDQTMPPRTWSPRQQVQHLNDFISLGTLDRADFWLNFVISFWAETPVALRLFFPPAAAEAARNNIPAGLMESTLVQNVDKYDIPYNMLAYFFHVWASNTMMQRLHFEVPQATEGHLPHGAAFLTSLQSVIETILLDGSLLIRQHTRTRFIFDASGRITLMEWHIYSHEEYFLSLRAGHLIAANFTPDGLNNSERLVLCRSGFPGSVHRMLEIHAVLQEVMGPDLSIPRSLSAPNNETYHKTKRRRKPNRFGSSTSIAE